MRYKILFIAAVLGIGLCSTASAALLGDATGNGKFDLGDAIYSLQEQAGLRTPREVANVTTILQILAGLNPVVVLPDRTPPSAPHLNTPTDIEIYYNLVKLWWSLSVDNVGVAGYAIFRNQIKVGEVAIADCADYYCAFNDTVGVSANTSYTYQVKAFDAAGNVSEGSNPIAVLTPNTSGTIDAGGTVN